MNRLIIRLAALVGILAAAIGVRTLASSADPQPAFSTSFDAPSDFYDNFDYGFSGHRLVDDPTWHGDHDTTSTATTTCGSPTTFRNITPGPDVNMDFSQMFWWCAPSGAGSGHLMTANDTTGYNIAWLSPRPTFTGITKVCFDINETDESNRHWWQVVFVDSADAVKYPDGTVTYPAFPPNGVARGTGGFDLGYVSPEFADPNGPTTRILDENGSQAGFKSLAGSIEWWQGGDFTFQNFDHSLDGITDKAARYQQCIEQQAGFVRFTRATPSGTQTFDIPGAQIPQDARRVVLEDDTYDAAKASDYNPNVVTWHWDNVQVFAASSTGTPPSTTTTIASTTTAPTTTQATTTTIASTTTAPSTTIATTTTQASTTTASTTTTLATTTVPPSTTTTLAPLTCPSGFTTSQRNWCLAVNARIAALEQRVAALGG